MSWNAEQSESAADFLRLYDECFHKRGLSVHELREASRKLMIAGGYVLQAFDWPEIALSAIHARLVSDRPGEGFGSA